MASNGAFDSTIPITQSTQQKNAYSDRSPLIGKDTEDGLFHGIIRPCIAELIGMCLFVFVGTMCVYQGTVIGIALTHGFAIIVLVAVMGPISGGHLNPVVTLGFLLTGKIGVVKAAMYVISQLVGAILGAAITKGVLTKSNFEAIHGGATMLPDETTVGQGILCEMVITALLVTTVLMTAADDDYGNPATANAPIGFSVAIGIIAGGNVSGASMNPARSFGPAVVDSSVSGSQWDYHYIYWVGPAMGSILAALWYRLFLAGPTKRLLNF